MSQNMIDWRKELPTHPLEAFEGAARILGIDLARWPLFKTFEVLPRDIRPFGFMFDPSYHDGPWTAEELDGQGWSWAPEVVDWWREGQVDRFLQKIKANHHIPDEHGRHITIGMHKTAQLLWEHRENLPQVLAILTLAWLHEKPPYEYQPGVRACLLPLRVWAYDIVGSVRWHHASTSVLPYTGEWDDITENLVELPDLSSVFRAILRDAWESQRRFQLVHLVQDPAFDLKQFTASLNRLCEAAREKRAANQRAWEAREQEQKQAQDAVKSAWLEEQRRREEHRELYRGFGAKAAAAELGVSVGALQNWVRRGLSLTQIQWLASRPKGRRGKSIDAQLIEAGLVPGVHPAHVWVAETTLKGSDS